MTTAQSSVELAVVFSTGLMISVGHCVGMCGPIAAAYSAAQNGLGRLGFGGALLTYHAGRVVTYTGLGAAFGLLGSTLGWSRFGTAAQGGISLFAGALMVALALGLLGWIPTDRLLEKGGFGGKVVCGASRLLRTRSYAGRFGLGLFDERGLGQAFDERAHPAELFVAVGQLTGIGREKKKGQDEQPRAEDHQLVGIESAQR